MPMQIPIEVARRFILGKQGLWPGRRWRGLDGAEAGDARHRAPPARSARGHRPGPRPDPPQPGHRLPPRRLGDADLRAAQVLRLGRLARGAADGGAPVLAGHHAPRAGPAQLDRVPARARARRSPRCATCWPSGARSATGISRWATGPASTTTGAARTARSRCTTCGGSATRWSRGASGSSAVYALTEAVAPRELIREHDAAEAEDVPDAQGGRRRTA